MAKKKSAYAQSGVDIELGNQVKESLPALLASTRRPEVLGEVGGFGGLFALRSGKYRQPVLVSSVDGVGTKLKVAFDMKKHDTIGQDLVNHCVNDIAILGAEPLFFLDYLGTGKLTPKIFDEILTGFALACRENNCALLGGETAQMPGFYQPGEYDVSGTIIGVVEKNRILDGKHVRPGDVVIGVESNGLHTNGYSLARRVLFEKMGLGVRSRVPELGRLSVGAELLRVHRSYGPLIQGLIRKFNPQRGKPVIRAMSHITGGGFVDNIPRNLPADVDAIIDTGTWEPQPVFSLIEKNGKIDRDEMYHVFNMGIGLTIVVPEAQAAAVVTYCRRRSHGATVIGHIAQGEGRVRLRHPSRD
jgi:phosphoribosylformylglycinamidine cyclo-ligase